MNHEAHEDVSTRATAARSAGRVERLLVSFVPLVAKAVDREISVIAVAADGSL
jgi:hypothetical protein